MHIFQIGAMFLFISEMNIEYIHMIWSKLETGDVVLLVVTDSMFSENHKSWLL